MTDNSAILDELLSEIRHGLAMIDNERKDDSLVNVNMLKQLSLAASHVREALSVLQCNKAHEQVQIWQSNIAKRTEEIADEIRKREGIVA